MGINTNALTLGGPLPATTPFQHNPDTVPDPQAHSGAGSAPTGSAAASGNDQAASAGGSATAGRKNAGASARTRRTAVSQVHGKARAAHAQTAATAAGSQAGSAPQDAAGPPADFGSAMASALGRSATHDTGSAPDAVATGTPTGAATSQQDPATSADAVAWFAQALMPAAAPASALTDPTGTAAGPAGVTSGSAAADSAAGITGLPPDLGAAAGRFPGTAASALRTRTNGAPPLQAPTPPTPDDQASASASALQLSDLTALAGAQKLIAGLTDANPDDTDSASPAAAPATHAASATDGMDAAQATAALQASSLIRPGTGLGGTMLTIHAPVNSPAFADEVSARVTGLAQSGITQAQLQLNPADLGPVQVHITLQSGQASVWFGATHADTRAALEQSLPRLRELFAGAGMPLSDSGVFRDPQQQQQAQSLAAAGNSRTTLSEPQDAPTVTQVANLRLSLLDTYA